ncbi:MAG: 2-C-methyl-D-erythritol 4-phosphate cytidylyltransferase [Lachnospiraceae bacterium]|nr:2-C-methyl-D-erythritol 4-phosphate cytidylyltransferase [Lachnospiraceae bacterium]
MVVAIVLAGGNGSRVQAEIPKQFIEVNKKPILGYTLEILEQSDEIDSIIVVSIDGWEDHVKEIAKQYSITKLKKVCVGSTTGLKSLYEGIKACNFCNEKDLILIHDAVRPFVDLETIHDNVQVAAKNGMAVACVDCHEDLVFTNDGVFSNKLVHRNGLKRVLTPQTYQYSIIKNLLESTNLDEATAPSSFALYMEKGGEVFCSKSNSRNIKLTYPSDIDYFRQLFT